MKIRYIVMTAAVALGLQSCSDWDDHYDVNNGIAGADATLWEQIKSKPELSNFAKLLEKEGYDKLLSTSQSFTIWAPNNDAYNYDEYNAMSDSLLKAEFLNNHIARGYYRGTGDVNDRVHLLNKKVMAFAGNGSSYTIGGKTLKDSSFLCKNGMMYLMDNMMDFRPNLYEYMSRQQADGFTASALGDIFKSKAKREIDKDNSVEGPMKDGEITYLDTVYVESNQLFTDVNAKLNAEDSTYTMIVPSNKAWEQAYNKVSSYFNYPSSIQPFVIKNDDKDGHLTYETSSKTNVAADSLQREMATCWTLYPLIYSHSINKVLREKEYPNAVTDSIRSTAGDVICNTLNYQSPNSTVANDASDMFVNATRQTVSNGYAWKTDSIRVRPWYWCPVITLRAQNGNYQAAIDNVTLAQNVSISNSERNPKVHGSMHTTAYYQVSSVIGSRPDVYFYIPKVWGTSYAVYMTMVPANITDSTATPIDQKIQIRSISHAKSGAAPTSLAPSPLKEDFNSSKNFTGATFNYGTKEDARIQTKYMGVFTPNFSYRGLTSTPEAYPAFNIRTTSVLKGESTVLRIAAITLVPMDAVKYYEAQGMIDDYKDDMPELFWNLNSITY